MELDLEQHFASVVRYIQDRAEDGSSVYFDDFPEDFAVPGLYYPAPRSSSRKVTFQTYQINITMEVWFLASTDLLSYAAASNVRDSILMDNCLLQMINKDGTVAKGYVQVSEPDIKSGGNLTGITKLTFVLTYHVSNGAEKPKANKISFSGLIKAGTVLDAWVSATEEQRKDEEVQNECLQKAIQQLP